MKRNITFAAVAAAVALLGFGATAQDAVVNFTTNEGYVAGSQLLAHPDWAAQGQWTIQAVGDGVAQDLSGGYVRGNYQGLGASNQEGDLFTVAATFSLIGDYTYDTNNLPDYAEPAFILNTTETGGGTPPGVIGCALALDDDLDPPELDLRLVSNASGSISLGNVSNYNGHTFTMSLEITKTGPTNYTATATLDSLDDAAPAFEVMDSDIVVIGSFAEATLVYGVMQGMPSAAQYYGGVEVDQFTYDSVLYVPGEVAFTPVLVPDVLVVDTLQLFITEGQTQLELASDPVAEDWTGLDGTLTDPGPRNVRYIIPPEDITSDDVFVRVVGIPPPEPLFGTDFEDGSDGWTVVTNAAHPADVWELGTPSLDNAYVTINTAASGVNAFGVDLDGDYYEGTDTVLVSPVFQLPATGPLTLEWQQATDIDDTPLGVDYGTVTLIDLDAGTTNLLTTVDGSTNDSAWSLASAAVPDTALDHSVQVEFHFVGDNLNPSVDWGGWYIDDVFLKD